MVMIPRGNPLMYANSCLQRQTGAVGHRRSRTRQHGVHTPLVRLAGGEGTADMLESAPVIGVALEAAKDGMDWVLVNLQ